MLEEVFYYFFAITGDLADLTNGTHANVETAVEVNGPPIQVKSFDNVTSESSDRNSWCKDRKASKCPRWKQKGYCTRSKFITYMWYNCFKTCFKCGAACRIIGGEPIDC